MQQGGRDGLYVHVQPAEDDGHLNRVRDERLAALAPLPLVRLVCELERLREHGLLVFRQVRPG